MLLRVPEVLSAPVVARVRALIEPAEWSDMRGPGNAASASGRGHRQLPEESKSGRAAAAIIMESLSINPLFFTGALPKKILPPQFHRHDPIASYSGATIESAMRPHAPTATQARVDIAAMLLLSDPREYEGGELILEDHLSNHTLKLRAGDVVIYPASTLTRVQTVARGVRLSAVLWVESMIREDERRRLLYELDMAITALRARNGDSDELARLTGCYHNLTRMWATP